MTRVCDAPDPLLGTALPAPNLCVCGCDGEVPDEGDVRPECREEVGR